MVHGVAHKQAAILALHAAKWLEIEAAGFSALAILYNTSSPYIYIVSILTQPYIYTLDHHISSFFESVYTYIVSILTQPYTLEYHVAYVVGSLHMVCVLLSVLLTLLRYCNWVMLHTTDNN